MIVNLKYYKCDECNKEIYIEENKKGLTKLRNCTITKDCKGKLYPIKHLSDYTVKNYKNNSDQWIRKERIYNHIQEYKSNKWLVVHNLNTTFPLVNVFLSKSHYDPNYDLTESYNHTINIINENQFEVALPADTEYNLGVQQVLFTNTDSTNIKREPEVIEFSDLDVYTSSDFLIFGILYKNNELIENDLVLKCEFIDQMTNQIKEINIGIKNQTDLPTQWNGFTKFNSISLSGQHYYSQYYVEYPIQTQYDNSLNEVVTEQQGYVDLYKLLRNQQYFNVVGIYKNSSFVQSDVGDVILLLHKDNNFIGDEVVDFYIEEFKLNNDYYVRVDNSSLTVDRLSYKDVYPPLSKI